MQFGDVPAGCVGFTEEEEEGVCGGGREKRSPRVQLIARTDQISMCLRSRQRSTVQVWSGEKGNVSVLFRRFCTACYRTPAELHQHSLNKWRTDVKFQWHFALTISVKIIVCRKGLAVQGGGKRALTTAERQKMCI